MSDGNDLPGSWSNEGSTSTSSRKPWRWIAVAVVVVLVAVGAFIAIQQIRKDQEKAWPAVLSVRPGGLGQQGESPTESDPEVEPGAYLWTDFQGWHLWIVNGDGVGPVRGTLTSDKDFDEAALAEAKIGSIRPDGATIDFTLPSEPAVVGIDFDPGFYTKRLELTLSEDIPIFEGNVKKRVKLPLVIEKLDADDPAATGN